MDGKDAPKEETPTLDDREGSDVELATADASAPVKMISVYDYRPEEYDGTCLRPLGLCELGGSCDACWYSPDHPRFKNRSN